jgi:hypothetical protein
MPDMPGCPFCGSALTHYGEGQSEYPWQCDACGAAVALDAAAGLARTRRWDRQAARGVHDEFPLAALEIRP